MKKPMMLIMVVLMVVGIVFVSQGVMMHRQVVVEEASFHELQTSYFNMSKQERDGAEANSELSGDLVKIANYPSDLLRLKLVGVGKMLTGIFVLLFGILIALIMMPIRLGMIIKKK